MKEKQNDDFKKYAGMFILAMLIFLGQDYFRSKNSMYKEYVTVDRYDEFKSTIDNKITGIDKKLDKIIDRMLAAPK